MDPTLPQMPGAQGQMGMPPAIQNAMMLAAIKGGATGGGAPPAGATGAAMGGAQMGPQTAGMGQIAPQMAPPPPMADPQMATPPVDPSTMAGGLGSQGAMPPLMNGMAGQQMAGQPNPVVNALMSQIPGAGGQ